LAFSYAVWLSGGIEEPPPNGIGGKLYDLSFLVWVLAAFVAPLLSTIAIAAVGARPRAATAPSISEVVRSS
jgi:hypothetical protein